MAGRPPYRAAVRLFAWAAANFAEFELLCLGYPGLAGLHPGRRGLSWLADVSGRLIASIVDQHLRPTRHAEGCIHRQCKPGCAVLEYEADMSEPVLAAEVEEARQQEEQMRALAAALNGGRDGAGQATH